MRSDHMHGEIRETATSESVLKQALFTKREQAWHSSSVAMSNCSSNRVIRILFGCGEHKHCDFPTSPYHLSHPDKSFDRIGKQHEALPTDDRVERVFVEINVLRIHDADLDVHETRLPCRIGCELEHAGRNVRGQYITRRSNASSSHKRLVPCAGRHVENSISGAESSYGCQHLISGGIDLLTPPLFVFPLFGDTSGPENRSYITWIRRFCGHCLLLDYFFF